VAAGGHAAEFGTLPGFTIELANRRRGFAALSRSENLVVFFTSSGKVIGRFRNGLPFSRTGAIATDPVSGRLALGSGDWLRVADASLARRVRLIADETGGSSKGANTGICFCGPDRLATAHWNALDHIGLRLWRLGGGGLACVATAGPGYISTPSW
jgi:hypothetical protein